MVVQPDYSHALPLLSKLENVLPSLPCWDILWGLLSLFYGSTGMRKPLQFSWNLTGVIHSEDIYWGLLDPSWCPSWWTLAISHQHQHMDNGVWQLILVTSWHSFDQDNLAVSQMLPVVREQQLGQRLCLGLIAALLLWRVGDLSWRDKGCALQYFFDCSLGRFIFRHRYSHLVCICDVSWSASTEVTYIQDQLVEKEEETLCKLWMNLTWPWAKSCHKIGDIFSRRHVILCLFSVSTKQR